MPAPYGVTATGFNAKTFEEIKTDLEARCREALGSSVDLSDESALGQLIAIFADRLADEYQLGQALYAAAFPDSASGSSLDRIAALTGITRAAPTFTIVSALITGTPGTVINDKIVSVPGVADAKFRVTYVVIPVGGSIVTQIQCINPGPIPVLAGTLTQIDQPVVGWASVTNVADQDVLGTLGESDAALRLRRERSIRTQGGAAFEAIRAKVLAVAGVTDCFVFNNETDSVIDTIPAHGFEVVVRGGTDAAIAQAIFDSQPVGIASHGTTTVAISDSQGGSHAIKLTRPTTLNVYVTINVTVGAAAPANADYLIKLAVVAYGDQNYRTGLPVVAQALVPSVFSAVPGVVDCAQPLIGLAAAPTLSTTITPTKRQIADLDTSRVVVNVTRV